MLENLRRKLQQFMQGRYGIDQLNRVLLYVSLGLIILTFFIHNTVLSFITTVSLVYLYFRMLSRNIQARYRENQWFLEKTEGVRAWIGRQKNHLIQQKDYHIYKCPGCGQKVRVPRGAGKIIVRCPKCGHEFMKRS